LGRIYRSLIISNGNKEKMTVAFVDTGVDETIISNDLANELGLILYGNYKSYSATGQVIEGHFTQVTFKDFEIEMMLEVGVSNIPFQSELSDEEGVEVILGVDFLQDAGIKLDFSK